MIHIAGRKHWTLLTLKAMTGKRGSAWLRSPCITYPSSEDLTPTLVSEETNKGIGTGANICVPVSVLVAIMHRASGFFALLNRIISIQAKVTIAAG